MLKFKKSQVTKFIGRIRQMQSTFLDAYTSCITTATVFFLQINCKPRSRNNIFGGECNLYTFQVSPLHLQVMALHEALIFLTSLSFALSFSGEFVPKSYYVIDHNGHKSATVYFRSKRAVELFPLLRIKRGGGSSSSSQSSAKSSSSSSSNSGGRGYGTGGPGLDYNPKIYQPDFGADFFNFPGASGGGGSGSFAHSFASSSSSASSGAPGQGGGAGFAGDGGHGYNGPVLFSRFGEDTGTGVHVSGAAQGPKGAFSSSSSSIDGNGKITYSVKSGKY